MNIREKAMLWEAINSYAESCGGCPAAYVHGNVRRMDAVVAIESIIGDIIARCRKEGEDDRRV